MTATQAEILLVEDDAPQRKALGGFLRKKGYSVLEADSSPSAERLARERPLDLVLTDLRLGGPDGVELLKTLRGTHPDLQAIVLTAYGSVDDAVRAMKAGAYDFVSKPVDLDRLETLIAKALERVSLSRENRGLRSVLQNEGAFSALIGESPALQQVKAIGLKVAPSRAAVLILGESGTGKEVLARSIHLASPRKAGPFVTVNCAALPESLIESELFGHERGAFTGATDRKPGRFELAQGGTLFLDEVGEIPLHVQVKLLNVLQSGRFERVGGTTTVSSDARIIAATNRDLQQQVSEGTFRADLFYRLNVVPMTMPPLRERRDDIPLLARHFLARYSDLSGKGTLSLEPDVVAHLLEQPFPGNVRELENWIERAVVLADGDRLTRDDFPAQLYAAAPPTPDDATSTSMGLDEQVASLERSLITAAYQQHNGNQSAAARQLKISERSIRYKMKKYRL